MFTNTDDLFILRGAKGGGDAPKPTQAEQNALAGQTDIADWQWQLAQDQAAIQNAMLPFYLEQAGFEYAPYERGSEYTALAQRKADLETKLKEYDAWNPTKSGDMALKPQLVQAARDELTQLESQLGQLPQPDTKGGQVVDYGGQSYLLTERADPTKALNEEIAQLGAERTLKALKGDIDVDPAVSQDLARQKETLHEELIRRLGPGYENTDAGQRALAEFDRNETMVNYGVRHGELSAAQAVQMTADDARQRREGQKAAGLQGYAHFPGSAANTAQGGSAGYGQVSSQLGTNRMNAFNTQSQNRQAQSQMWGQLAGGGLTAAAGIGFAV
jgi:hypothetical protein